MISSRNGFRRKLMCAMLLISILLMAGCAPAATPEPQVITRRETVVVKETKIVEKVVKPTEVVERVVEDTPVIPALGGTMPPLELAPVEVWHPYEQGIPLPVGNAVLAPGYLAVRQGVAVMNEGLKNMLFASGVYINIARAVVLTETGTLSQPTGLDSDAALFGFVEQKVDHPGAWRTDFLVYDNGQWRRQAPEPRQLTYAGTATATPTECPGAASRTYVTTQDNENNAHSGSPDGDMGPERRCTYRHHAEHPIEFNIHVPSLPPGFSQAWLSLIAWDVDEEASQCPERDEVYFNGHFVNYLRGANDTFSTSGPYPIDPSWVRQGNNLVEIQVNATGCLRSDGSEFWCVGIKQGTLKLEGGTGAAYESDFLQSPRCWPPGSTGYVEVNVDTTLDSQEIRVEINVIDAQNNVLVGGSHTGVIHGAQDDAFVFSLPIPADAQPGDYTIQVIIYDTCSETIQESTEHRVRIDCATLVETVSIAPVAAKDYEDPDAFDQDKLGELLAMEGVVLGMLVLETNWPNSLIPSGEYLERARLDGNQSVVELIDVTSGETVHRVQLLAEKVEDSTLIPSASIFLGTKWCLTHIDGWYFCRPCFFWEPVMSYEECHDRLSEGTP